MNSFTETLSDLQSAAHALAFHATFPLKSKHRTRIFMFRDGGIGDILCTLPSLAALREEHPEAYIVYAAFRSFHPLIAMSGLADTLLDSGGYAKWRCVTDRYYDHLYHPYYEDEMDTGLPLVHVVDDFARKIGVRLNDRQPHLPVADDLREQMRLQVDRRRRTGPVIAAQIGPSWPVRMWPQRYWATLVQRLHEELDAVVLLLGADFHQETGHASAERIPGAVDWIGRHSLPETAAVLSLCDLFVGIDSGLLHMAGAVGTPGVGLFGPVDPALRLPPVTPSVAVQAEGIGCLGCHHRNPRIHWKTGCPHEIACMASLTPEAVFKAIVGLLP